MIHFEIPKNQSSIIKVIGVGGGGSNAVNYMYSLGIDGVDFLVCNTDSQALTLSPVPNKIQLGPHLTQGLGAGANPEIGKQASEESIEDITKILKVNTRMAFITAGMGGGTGTGGAPVVAKICRDLGILTVGIVSTPFTYEGRKRMKQAQEGIERLRDHVDTILIISNDKLRQQCGNMPFRQAFAKADDILATAAKCITDVITTTGQINVDFADVCTVMKNGGVAILGSATASGENRALEAVESALNSPLLNDNDIYGAKWILLNITSSSGEFEHTMDEAEAIQAYVQQQAGDNCDVILGMGNDPSLEDRISVTVIATGFNQKEISSEMPERKSEPSKIVMSLDKQAESAPAAAPETTASEAASAPSALVSNELSTNTEQQKPDEIKLTTTMSNIATVSATAQGDMLIFDSGIINSEPKQQEVNNAFGMQLHTKAESTANFQDSNPVKVGERFLTEHELEEKRRFEEQKRQLEERAERLRNLSFNIKGGTEAPASTDDMENVPAYIRQKMNLDDSVSSSDKFYSGYTVAVNNDRNNQASIQTINTFLEGKKPD